MKIARVFVQEYPGKQIGDIHDVFDSENHPGSLLSGTIKEVEVADDFNPAIMKGVIAEDGSITFVVDLAKNAAKIIADKTAQIAERYNDMNADVFAQMATVFGTTRTDSATAYHETWQLMKAKPNLFWQSGLKAHVAYGGIAVGGALNTIQKVEDYATAALEAVEAYSVARMVRIKQFQDEKAAIEGA